MSPVQKTPPQIPKILVFFFSFCTSHMSSVEQQHLRSTQTSRSLSLPQVAGGEMLSEVTALSLWVTVQVRSAITKFVPPLGTWGIFHPVQRSPTAQPSQNSISNCEMPLLGGDKYYQKTWNTEKFGCFPWCAKSNAVKRFAWEWKFLLQCLNRVTSPLHLFSTQETTELILRSKCPVGNAGRRWNFLCLYVAFKTALCNLTRVCLCVYALMYRVRSLVLLELLILAWFALEYLTLWITINDLPCSRGFGTGIPSFLDLSGNKYLWSLSRPPGSIPWL